MKIFYAPQTRAVRIFWMLEEAGIEYAKELVDIRAPERNDPAEFLAASPLGKVPAIVDGDVAMAESSAICLYVADKYRYGELAPRIEDPDRGRFLYWLMYTPAVIEPAMSEKFSKTKPNRLSNAWGDFDLMIKVFDDGMEGRQWVLGDKFSAADVMLGSSAVFMRMFDMLPEAGNISAYADRCLARPAYQQAAALSEG